MFSMYDLFVHSYTGCDFLSIGAPYSFILRLSDEILGIIWWSDENEMIWC